MAWSHQNVSGREIAVALDRTARAVRERRRTLGVSAISAAADWPRLAYRPGTQAHYQALAEGYRADGATGRAVIAALQLAWRHPR